MFGCGHQGGARWPSTRSPFSHLPVLDQLLANNDQGLFAASFQRRRACLLNGPRHPPHRRFADAADLSRAATPPPRGLRGSALRLGVQQFDVIFYGL